MTDQNGSDGAALGHLRVLDLGGPTPQFATRLLGDLGADVIKIEPPGGDPLRNQAPFAGNTLILSAASRSFLIITTSAALSSTLKLMMAAIPSAASPPQRMSSLSASTEPTSMTLASATRISQPPTLA